MKTIKGISWWKYLGALLVLYSIIQGFLGPVPVKPILNETIRNLYFHVTMWFAMIILLSVSVIYGIKYLQHFKEEDDTVASETVNVAMVLGICGLLTGMIWANFTWGEPWPNDPKLNGVAVAMLFYIAYLILRGSIEEKKSRAKISAVYNIFAFCMFLAFTLIIPRMTDSLHPGNGGNPGFGKYDDLNNTMRLVFYPAIVGWTLIALWIVDLRVRYKKLQYKLEA